MSTASQLISDTLQDIGALATGQTMSADDADVCLRRLNMILETWSNSRLMFPVLSEVSVTLTGAASYTIGPSGADVTAARPIKVMHATVVDSGGIESPIAILTRAQWDAIGLKAVDGGPPGWIWYEAANTTGRVYVYPKANSGTLKLDVLSLLTSFALDDEVTLPPGYESALRYTLGVDVCPVFGRTVSQDMRQAAAGAVRALKRTNYEPIPAFPPSIGRPLIQRGF